MTHKLRIIRYILSICFICCFSIKISSQTVDADTISKNKKNVDLDEVIIEQDARKKMSGTLSGKVILNVEAVKSMPAIMGNVDVLKMLELTPGVQTSGDGNTNLYVRGGDPGQNLLLYGGNTIYTPGHILSFFPLFNINHLSSVELLKSGVDAQYGGFLSSTVAVRSKTSLPSKTNLKGDVGILSSQATLELVLNNSWGAYISGRKTYLELLLKPLLGATINNNAENDLNNMKYDFYDSNVTLIGQISAKNKLIVDAFLGTDKLDITEEEIAIDGFLQWSNLSLSAKLETSINDRIAFEQSILYSAFDNQLETSQSSISIHLKSTIKDVGYKNRLMYKFKGIPMESGMSYIYHDLLPQKMKMINASITYENEAIKKSRAHDWGIFTSAVLKMNSKLVLEPGLRYNIFSSSVGSTGKPKTFHSIDLRFLGRYQLSEDQFLRGSYSHNNQYINKLTPSSLGLPTDFWVSASNDVLPQYGDELSAGYYRSFLNGDYELSSDIYYRQMKNATEFNQSFLANEDTPYSDKIYYGRGKAYGIELILKKNSGRLTGWFSYSLGKADRKFDDINHGKTFPARFDRTHDLSIVSSYHISHKWDVSLVYKYATGNAYTQPSSWYFVNGMPVKDYDKYNGSRMPDYNRTDINVNYWFRKNNGLNFSIYNIFAVNNPVYTFLLVRKDKYSDKIIVNIKNKKLFTMVPSISWKFNF
ncbi:MAG: TonB-dependent receptor plug domain-containing protein [Dysgonomonas sp.]